MTYQLGEQSRADDGQRGVAGRSDEFAELNPILTQVDFRYAGGGSAQRDTAVDEFAISLRRRSRALAAAATESEQPLQSWVFDVSDIDASTRADLFQWLEIQGDAEPAGANTQHFFPYQIAVRYDAGKDKARKIAKILFSVEELGKSTRQRDLIETLIPLSVANRVISFNSELIEKFKKSSRITEFSEDEWNNLFGPEPKSEDLPPLVSVERILKLLERRRMSPFGDLKFSSDAAAVVKEIEEQLTGFFGEEMRVANSLSREALSAVGYAQSYFLSSIKYLGPLRDEPRPFYPLEALGNPTDVGYRGEHTAAVLDLHRDVYIRYFQSPDKSSSADFRQITTVTLKSAVIDWLTYMGVAEDFSTSDRGTLGHTLKVSPSSTETLYDLTNVGVGVSQVLPIVVMTLLTEAPCTLIFEQPELHLHPKVQARLADFFLAASLQGKQCILETHSEYLIERLRRRIAEASDIDIQAQVQIYFAERHQGSTKCTPIQVSRYGAISNWPKDFFDQSQVETEQILLAAKRKRELERDRISTEAAYRGQTK